MFLEFESLESFDGAFTEALRWPGRDRPRRHRSQSKRKRSTESGSKRLENPRSDSPLIFVSCGSKGGNRGWLCCPGFFSRTPTTCGAIIILTKSSVASPSRFNPDSNSSRHGRPFPRVHKHQTLALVVFPSKEQTDITVAPVRPPTWPEIEPLGPTNGARTAARRRAADPFGSDGLSV